MKLFKPSTKSRAAVHGLYFIANNYVWFINLNKHLHIYMYIERNNDITLDSDYDSNNICKTTRLMIIFYSWVK